MPLVKRIYLFCPWKLLEKNKSILNRVTYTQLCAGVVQPKIAEDHTASREFVDRLTPMRYQRKGEKRME